MLSQDFEVLSRLVKAESGLTLTPDKAYLLETRLLPIARKWKFDNLAQLAESLRTRRDAAQVREVTEAMTVNESFFFRDVKPFDLLRDKLLPALRAARGAKRLLRIWSAASSTGQEAYSIAMLLTECGAYSDGWTIDITGTDLSTEIVERACAGVYNTFEVQRGLPAKLLVKYFTREADQWQVAESIRRKVRFTRHNLLHDPARLGFFDIVFCRNVLIYFDVATKASVLHTIRQRMPADGYLVLGGAETVMGISDSFAFVAELPGVYVPSEPKAKSPPGTS
jgi:chemotaxis protein methyltransferase CheR